MPHISKVKKQIKGRKKIKPSRVSYMIHQMEVHKSIQ